MTVIVDEARRVMRGVCTFSYGAALPEETGLLFRLVYSLGFVTPAHQSYGQPVS